MKATISTLALMACLSSSAMAGAAKTDIEAENGSYVASVASTAPFRVCAPNEIAYLSSKATIASCNEDGLFGSPNKKPLSAQEYLDTKCPGAVMTSHHLFYLSASSTVLRAEITFKMPAQGCPASL